MERIELSKLIETVISGEQEALTMIDKYISSVAQGLAASAYVAIQPDLWLDKELFNVIHREVTRRIKAAYADQLIREVLHDTR